MCFTHLGVWVLGQGVEAGRLEGDRLTVREGIEGRLSSRNSHAAFAFAAEAFLGGQAFAEKKKKIKKIKQTQDVNNRFL